MRLFVAIPIPASISRALIELKSNERGFRWVPEGNHHITLKFLGETDPSSIPEIHRALSEIHLQRFSLRLDGLGSFSSKGRPSVLWAGVGRIPPHLPVLHRKVLDALWRVGFEPERRSFHPHVTLARIEGVSSQAFSAYRKKQPAFVSDDFPVGNFTLYQSRSGSGGVRYGAIGSYGLYE